MKRFFLSMLTVALLTPMAYAQDVQQVTTPEPEGIPIIAIFGSILMLAITLAVIGHMVYENFFRKPLRADYTVEEFKAQRAAEGLSEEMSEEDMAVCMRMNEYQKIWTQVPSDDEEPSFIPTKKKHFDIVNQIIADTVATKPTEQEVVDLVNELNRVMNSMMKREFNGSKTIIVVSIIVGVVLGLLAGGFPIFPIAAGIIIYLFASRTPVFVLARKELQGKGGGRSFLTLVMGGLFSTIATAKTYKTVTTWSDGSTTTDTDNSETWISLAITFIVAAFIAVFLWAISLISYVRNYWLYF